MTEYLTKTGQFGTQQTGKAHRFIHQRKQPINANFVNQTQNHTILNTMIATDHVITTLPSDIQCVSAKVIMHAIQVTNA